MRVKERERARENERVREKEREEHVKESPLLFTTLYFLRNL